MVLVSHKHKFIYIKNYKVAGTSVETMFEKYCIDDDEHCPTHMTSEKNSKAGIIGSRTGPYEPPSDEYKKSKWKMHKSATFIKKELGDDVFDSYYKFCVVRNPWDVAVSSYYFRQGLHEIEPKQNPLFKSFNVFTRGLKYNTLNNWSLYTIDNKPVCDYHIRYENLKEDILKVVSDLKLPNFDIDKLPTYKNEFRKNKNYRELYDDELTERVRNFCSSEIEYFDYKF